MQHYQSLEKVNLNESWLTIGSYDGVHRGHQEILQEMVSGARAQQVSSVVLTLFPHPAVVLRGQRGPYYLSTPEERARLLGEQGVDLVITLPFSRELANVSALDFMTEIKQRLKISQLWVGYNFTLGRNREGDAQSLARIGQLLDYELRVIPPISIDGEIVSSSLIRGLLEQGNVEHAAELLGRPYTVEGDVVAGDGRGRTLGIPTANLSIWPEWMLPSVGVYSSWAIVDGERYLAVSNIGMRPTFEHQPLPLRLETHLIDFHQNLYGRKIRLEFIQRLRGEQRYSSADALVAQIHQDIQRTRETLRHGA